MLGSRKLRIVIVVVAVAVALPLVYEGAATFSPKCSFGESYLPYNQENTENWARISKVILIGTVKDIQVKLVEQVGDIGEVPTGAYAISKLPYKFITVVVEDYLVDRTGSNAKEVTFRTWANGCVDAFGNFSPIEKTDYVTYTVGEKSLLTVQDQLEDGTLTQGTYTYKFDIITRNGTEVVERNDTAQIPERPLSDLVHEMMDAIERQNADASTSMQLAPTGISLNIEEYGRREFYQDEHVGMPTNVTITDNRAFSEKAVIAWPSIGPNFIITKSGDFASEQVVFDYYESLGISTNLSGLEYDESVKARDLEPPPATFGRYFGFEWNQITMDGTIADPGRYQVLLTIPVMIKGDDEQQGQQEEEKLVLSSKPESFTIIEGKPAPQSHDLALEYNVSSTDLLTDEPYGFSLYLVNKGNHTESFTVDRHDEEGSCYWGRTGKLENPDYMLPPGGRIDLAKENNLAGAPKTPGTYSYTPFVMLSIDDPTRVECLRVEVNQVTLNVTARVFEGVKLIVTTNKNTYERNENVAIDLYIENNSGTPFKLQEIQPSITIKNASGRVVYGIGWVADYSEYPVVWPYSRYAWSGVMQLNWDQTVYLEDGGAAGVAEPGEYLIEATFTAPYLKSDVHSIIIQKP